jgi:hypothetical protein
MHTQRRAIRKDRPPLPHPCDTKQRLRSEMLRYFLRFADVRA